MKGFTRSVLVVLVLLSAVFAQAQQQQEETVTIPKSQLTEQQKAELAQRAIDGKIEQYGKWVGIGHEIGVSLNEGLSAISTQANNFAQTPVGKWTVAVIVFKVVGNQFIHLLIGIIMTIVGVPIWIWSYRRFLPKRYVKRVKYAADGKTKDYEEYEYGFGDMSEDVANGWCIGHWVILVIYTIVTLFTIFAG